MSKKKKPASLVFDSHAVDRMKQRGIPREVVRQIAMYGFVVKTERIANWVTHVKRGEYKGKPIHVVVKGNCVIKTTYWADEWEMRVNVRRHRGVKQPEFAR